MTKTWQESYDLGKRAFDEKNYKGAQTYLEKVLKEKDNFADVYNMLGLIYYGNSSHEDAIKYFK